MYVLVTGFWKLPDDTENQYFIDPCYRIYHENYLIQRT